jgi:hypothetical protein
MSCSVHLSLLEVISFALKKETIFEWLGAEALVLADFQLLVSQ